MISRIRRDSTTFDKYQHNKELVALVNMFADTSQDLPHGWDTKKDRNSKVCRNRKKNYVWVYFNLNLTNDIYVL